MHFQVIYTGCQRNVVIFWDLFKKIKTQIVQGLMEVGGRDVINSIFVF